MEFAVCVLVLLGFGVVYMIGVTHGLRSAEAVERMPCGMPKPTPPQPVTTSPRRLCPCGDPACMEGP